MDAHKGGRWVAMAIIGNCRTFCGSVESEAREIDARVACVTCELSCAFERMTVSPQSYNASSARLLDNMKTFLRHSGGHMSQGDAAPLHILEN